MANLFSTPIQVVGIGLDGAAGLSDTVRQLVTQATVLVGSNRHLGYFPEHPGDRILLDSFTKGIDQIRQRLSTPDPVHRIVILTSGDPLFFGLGRLLLAELPSEWLTFHPHSSSVQLAFSRIKVPWQDAHLVSAHGRSLDELTQALRDGAEKIAVLTDATNSPAAIAQLLRSLDLLSHYKIWVCENLGGAEERVQVLSPDVPIEPSFAPLNVVVLLRQSSTGSDGLEPNQLPTFGLGDGLFYSFRDRPGLMTKREIRMLALGELALQPDQVIWDIGAGTGSVSVEIARLSPNSRIYAVEKTAIGRSLIEQNCQRFQVTNVIPIHGMAPEILHDLPQPDRIFIGGSSGQLSLILDYCESRLSITGLIVLALATLEHLATVTQWLQSRSRQAKPDYGWHSHLLQVQLSRSVAVGPLTRFSPLNPVTLVVLQKMPSGSPP